MVDTNCNPDEVDYVIPSNDDATRAICLISDIMANAVLEGRNIATEGAAQAEAEGEEEDEAAESFDEEVIAAAEQAEVPVLEAK